MTEGTLVRAMMRDPLLARYSVVMLDEAHERTAQFDLVLGLLVRIMQKRPTLRLIVASATINAVAIKTYLDVHIRGPPLAPHTHPSTLAPRDLLATTASTLTTTTTAPALSSKSSSKLQQQHYKKQNTKPLPPTSSSVTQKVNAIRSASSSRRARHQTAPLAPSISRTALRSPSWSLPTAGRSRAPAAGGEG